VTGLTARFGRLRHYLTLTWSRGTTGLGTMQYLLILLVAITVACGAAAGVTIALAPAYADYSAKGY
jgi:hypothetical protein